MTSLRLALERYLSMRQGLGYKYRDQARRLRDFVAFMEARKAKTITAKLALAWASLPPRSQVASARRLIDVRGFARHVGSRRVGRWSCTTSPSQVGSETGAPV
jgi:hypothetical protein